MNTSRPIIRHLISLLLFVCVVLPTAAFGTATITIVNVDGPGEGFNDPAPVKPVGKNTGRTLGQQRLIAFQFAADIWGTTIDSNVAIKIQASFDPLSCTANSGVLGSAGPTQIVSDFPGAEFANTWYAVALGNKEAGLDLVPGLPGTNADDIGARFNSSLGAVKPDGTPCLTGLNWYYGLDDKHGNNIDLVTVLLHEFAHGLGFLSVVNEANGSEIHGLTDIFSRHILDNTTGLTWDQMTNAQRKASALSSRNVVWNGTNVFGAVPSVLSLGTPLLKVNSPSNIAGNRDVGTASFGAPVSSPGVTGDVAAALDPADATGPSTTDACSPVTSTVSGRIALLDRGSCAFATKVKNAQNAGAIGVIVADNLAETPPPGMGGSDSTISIPSVMISQADGANIRNQLGVGVNASLTLNLSIRAGADTNGRALLFTPDPVQPGSSVSHWDTIAFPNQLMEPAINGDLTHSVVPPNDLTFKLLRDLGW